MNAMIDDRPISFEMHDDQQTRSDLQARHEEVMGDTGYRELSGRTIGALALALASPLALVHAAFWPLPLLALALSVSALKRIRDVWPDVRGRGLALSAMALALIFGISALLQPLLYRYSMRAQAANMAAEWFDRLRQGDAEAAKQLTVANWFRSTAGVSVDQYHARLARRGEYKPYPEQAPVELLLGLGRSAHVRLYKNLGVVYNDFDETDRVESIYSVADGSATDRVATYIKLTLTRRLDLLHRVRSWEVTKAEVTDDPSKAEQAAVGADDADGRSDSDEGLEWREKVRRTLIRKQQSRP